MHHRTVGIENQLKQHPLRGLVAQIEGKTTRAEERLHATSAALKDEIADSSERTKRVLRKQMQSELDSTQGQYGKLSREIQQLGKAAVDDIELALLQGSIAEDITAAELNGGAAGTVTRKVTVVLQSADGKLHPWGDFANTPTGGETVADADVAAPTITWALNPAAGPEFRSGCMELDVVFDTDAGATKTYVAAETLTVTVDVSAIPWCVNVTNLVKTYTVV